MSFLLHVGPVRPARYAPPTFMFATKTSNWAWTGAPKSPECYRPAEWSRTDTIPEYLSGDLSGLVLLARFHSVTCPKVKPLQGSHGLGSGGNKGQVPLFLCAVLILDTRGPLPLFFCTVRHGAETPPWRGAGWVYSCISCCDNDGSAWREGAQTYSHTQIQTAVKAPKVTETAPGDVCSYLVNGPVTALQATTSACEGHAQPNTVANTKGHSNYVPCQREKILKFSTLSVHLALLLAVLWPCFLPPHSRQGGGVDASQNIDRHCQRAGYSSDGNSA